MKFVAASVTALCTLAIVPALAAEHTDSVTPSFQAADAGDFAHRKAEYEARARHEMTIWQRRMSKAGAQTQEELDRAWAAAKEQWADLQQTTTEGWDRSRTAFESASARMKDEWHKYYPNDE